MSFQPKRPSAAPTGASPSGRPTPVGSPSTRPSNIREANAEAYAIGGGAVVRASATVASSAVKKTILLVDSDAELRARLRALLEPHYDILEARDGLEAVEITSGIQPPALVVSDTAMPRLDGFTFAKILRNNPVMKRVPIMFVSAQDGPQYVTQALVIGVKQYVAKSTPVAQIAEKIRKIVQ